MSPEARNRSRIRTPVLAVTVIAWATMLADHLVPPPDPGTARTDHHTAGPGHNIAGMAHAPHLDAAGRSLMLAAMMAPLLIPALRHVHARSLPRRRWRAIALVTAGYAATWWAAIGILQATATTVHAAAVHGVGVPIVLGLVAALVWQASPLKQSCLNRHHTYPPIAAFGTAAWLDPLRYGLTHALWCTGSCWALMLLPLIATDRSQLTLGAAATGGPLAHDPRATACSLALMAVVSLWIWAESFNNPAAPDWRLRGPMTAARIIARLA
jgi:predicted metal-binding membrane protein